MYCIICGAKFVSSCEDKTCPTCDGAVNRMFPGISAEHLLELVKAEQDGRLVVQDIFMLFPIECSNKCEKYVDDRIGCKGLEAAVTAPGGEWPFMIKTCPKEVVRTKATQEKLQLARSGKADKDGVRFFLTREAAEAALEGGAEK